MATGYTKTLVLKTTGNNVTLTGGRAANVAKRLDDMAGLVHFTDPTDDKNTLYYKLDSTACGLCLIATMTAGTTTVADPECEDELACPEDSTDGDNTDGGDDNGGDDNGGDDNGGDDNGGDDNGGEG